MSIRLVLTLALLIGASAALAQNPRPTEYPPEAVALGPEVIQQRLAGRVFSVKPADGSTWRLEFKDTGWFYIDTDRGYRDSGKWRIDGTQWCADLSRSGVSCSELREKDGQLYYRRVSNGEIVQLLPR